MKKFSLALVLASALGGAMSASAGYSDLLLHGNSCYNTTAGVTLSYTQWGPMNPSTTTGAYVNCPMHLPDFNYTSVYLQLEGWSRNSSASKLSCTMHMTGGDGYNMTQSTATVSYNTAAAGVATTSFSPTSWNVWPYLTCYIPPNNGNGYSYLSTIYVQGSY